MIEGFVQFILELLQDYFRDSDMSPVARLIWVLIAGIPLAAFFIYLMYHMIQRGDTAMVVFLGALVLGIFAAIIYTIVLVVKNAKK